MGLSERQSTKKCHVKNMVLDEHLQSLLKKRKAFAAVSAR